MLKTHKFCGSVYTEISGAHCPQLYSNCRISCRRPHRMSWKQIWTKKTGFAWTWQMTWFMCALTRWQPSSDLLSRSFLMFARDNNNDTTPFLSESAVSEPVSMPLCPLVHVWAALYSLTQNKQEKNTASADKFWKRNFKKFWKKNWSLQLVRTFDSDQIQERIMSGSHQKRVHKTVQVTTNIRLQCKTGLQMRVCRWLRLAARNCSEAVDGTYWQGPQIHTVCFVSDRNGSIDVCHHGSRVQFLPGGLYLCPFCPGTKNSSHESFSRRPASNSIRESSFKGLTFSVNSGRTKRPQQAFFPEGHLFLFWLELCVNTCGDPEFSPGETVELSYQEVHQWRPVLKTLTWNRWFLDSDSRRSISWPRSLWLLRSSSGIALLMMKFGNFQVYCGTRTSNVHKRTQTKHSDSSESNTIFDDVIRGAFSCEVTA